MPSGGELGNSAKSEKRNGQRRNYSRQRFGRLMQLDPASIWLDPNFAFPGSIPQCNGWTLGLSLLDGQCLDLGCIAEACLRAALYNGWALVQCPTVQS